MSVLNWPAHCPSSVNEKQMRLSHWSRGTESLLRSAGGRDLSWGGWREGDTIGRQLTDHMGSSLSTIVNWLSITECVHDWMQDEDEMANFNVFELYSLQIIIIMLLNYDLVLYKMYIAFTYDVLLKMSYECKIWCCEIAHVRISMEYSQIE